MAYITVERVAEIRNELKATFPDFKFSVRRRHHSCVDVAIIEAPFNMLVDTEKTYEGVNYFYISEHYKNHPEIRDVLLKVYEIMNKGNYNKSEPMTDYFEVGFYVSLSIGDYEKPFTVKAPKATAKNVAPAAAITVNSEDIKLQDYSEKAFVITGNTKPIKEKLKELGGKFNAFLSCGAGWVFSKKQYETVKSTLNL